MSKQMKDARIIVDSKEISTFMNSLEAQENVDALECTNLRSVNREYFPGMPAITINGTGYQDYVDFNSFLQGKLQVADVPISLAELGGSVGDPAWILSAMFALYNPLQGEVAGLGAFTFQAMASKAGMPFVHDARVLEDALTERTATFNGTGVQFAAASSSQKIWAALHVLKLADTLVDEEVDVKIQSDTSGAFGSPTDIITFSNFAALGSETKSANGPNTDTFYRVNVTIAGSDPAVLIFVTMGIEP